MVIKNRIRDLLVGSDRVELTPVTRAIAMALALPLAAFEFWLALVGSVSPVMLGVVFISPLYVIAFLTTSGVTGDRRLGAVSIAWAAAVAASGIYLIANGDRYADWTTGLSRFTSNDLIAGTVMVAATFVLMKRCVGLGMTLVVAVLFGYVAYGHLLPGILSHRYFPLKEIIEQSIISENGGLAGAPVRAAAVYVFLFVVFGKMLQVSGGGQFFFDLAALVAGRRQGGIAKVSVVSSGLFGMISGSPTADIVTTGSITIPMMKKAGYSARVAAAIETVASVGGSFLPPVMGAVVFLLVQFTGTPYSQVISASIIIAILYYLSIYLQVHHLSVREGIGRLERNDLPTVGAVLRRGWPYVVPLGTLIYMIEQGLTPQYSVTVATALVVVFSWVNPNPEFRLGPVRLARVLTDASIMLAPLVAAVAGAGLVEQSLNITGLASKISYSLFAAAAGMPILLLTMAAFVTIIFGMGMPVTAVYTLAAVLLAPGLVQAGFDLLPTHLFLVWFAVASHITPPIAVAAYVAATIAQTPPMAASVTSARMGIVCFLIPFAFMLRPGLLAEGAVPQIVFDSGIAAVSIFVLAACSVGFCGSTMGRLVRVAAAACALVALFSATMPELSLATALAALGILAANHVLLNAQSRAITLRDRKDTSRVDEGD